MDGKKLLLAFLAEKIAEHVGHGDTTSKPYPLKTKGSSKNHNPNRNKRAKVKAARKQRRKDRK